MIDEAEAIHDFKRVEAASSTTACGLQNLKSGQLLTVKAAVSCL